MRNLVPLSAILAVALAVFSTRGADAAPFANFVGDYLKHGRTLVFDDAGSSVNGKASLRFNLGKNGSGRLRITGTIKFDKAVRSFSSLYVFPPVNQQGLSTPTFSNLAPGIDDGKSAKGGTYTSSPRSINATVPFVIGTTTGTATALVRLKRTAQGTKILVTQTLTTNSLPHPLTWKFSARSSL